MSWLACCTAPYTLAPREAERAGQPREARQNSIDDNNQSATRTSEQYAIIMVFKFLTWPACLTCVIGKILLYKHCFCYLNAQKVKTKVLELFASSEPIATFSYSSGVVWTENIWCVYRVKLPFSIPRLNRAILKFDFFRSRVNWECFVCFF